MVKDSPKNGTVWKWIAGVLVMLLMASVGWIWNAGGEAAVVKSDVAAVRDDIDTVIPIAAGNKEAIIGISKDIEQLQDKVGELKTEQTKMITEQRTAFEKVMDRLPVKQPPRE